MAIYVKVSGKYSRYTGLRVSQFAHIFGLERLTKMRASGEVELIYKKDEEQVRASEAKSLPWSR